MQLSPYLVFDGQCKAAFQFYETCLNGKLVAMFTHGETPIAGDVPADWHDRIIHARLALGDKVLMGSDCPPGFYEKPQGFSVSHSVDSPEEAERIFAALSEDASIRMPIQETFWAHRFAMLTDRFGTPWMIACDKPM